MFSIVQSFFFKFNAHNRIENGILEKILSTFLTTLESKATMSLFISWIKIQSQSIGVPTLTLFIQLFTKIELF